MHAPDDQIRAWCRDGDQRSFDAFFRVQADRLWRFLVARGTDPEAAYDLVATTFERFVATVCRRPDAPVALLYRIARNASTDAWRRQQVRDPGTALDAAEVGVDGDRAEHLAEVDQLLAGLDPVDRDLLLLRYWAGLTHRETAEVVDLPEGMVRRRVAGLLQRLAPDSG